MGWHRSKNGFSGDEPIEEFDHAIYVVIMMYERQFGKRPNVAEISSWFNTALDTNINDGNLKYSDDNPPRMVRKGMMSLVHLKQISLYRLKELKREFGLKHEGIYDEPGSCGTCSHFTSDESINAGLCSLKALPTIDCSSCPGWEKIIADNPPSGGEKED